MATYSSTLAWKVPWAEEPGQLQSVGSQRIRHGLATKQQRRGIKKISIFFFHNDENGSDIASRMLKHLIKTVHFKILTLTNPK